MVYRHHILFVHHLLLAGYFTEFFLYTHFESSYPPHFLIAERIPDKINSGKEGSILVHGVGGRSSSSWQGYEASGPIVSGVRKQREMSPVASLPSVFTHSGIPAIRWI